MFPVCKAPGPQHSTILRPKKPLGSWNLVNPLLRINEAWTDECAARLQPLADHTNPYNTKLSQQKIPRFDRNNPIMSWGQKHKDKD